ncbi:MAG TPA: alkaline phosphatase family protein [Anaerolineae bacterium]|nr:alkaline phosphatase family protein [Anaerolineae bacterium]
MRTLIIGLDALAPAIFEQLSAQGKLPHLTQYAERGGYAPLEISNPPQSEVSWTSIATGLNPGHHGIFDFVHRDPNTYLPYVSLLQTKSSALGTQFIPPHTATTLFEEATRQGYPATVLWWPATFPARPELPVRSLPGLGTPDIQGRFGVGTFFVSDPAQVAATRKTPVECLQTVGAGVYQGTLRGPVKQKRGGTEQVTLPVRLEAADERTAHLWIGKQRHTLMVGLWSPLLEVTFSMGALLKVHAITRVILTQLTPEVRLYFMPLQLHPLHSLWRYGSPQGFVKQTWQAAGPFLTLGMPQDTTGLEDGCFNHAQFLALCDSIVETRERVLLHHLAHFREGVLASVFDTLDRIQHIFWGSDQQVVWAWYEKLDALVGRIGEKLGQESTKVVIVSDHGISQFRHKVHLNRWLIAQGIMRLDAAGAVDWTQSRAYALGLNSLYVNLAGRERDGIVAPEQYRPLLEQLKQQLLQWRGPDGQPVVSGAWRQDEAFEGPLATCGPDLVVGYAPGYRASSETGLGKWGDETIESNHDRWGADHCIDYRAVPGVLFTNQDLSGYPHPSYRDIPALTIGATPPQKVPRPPQTAQTEDQKTVEERLKSLGYL